MEARGLRWTITDTALSPDQRFLLYASISSKVHLVNVGSNHDQVVSIANITEIHEELDFRGNQGSDYDGFAVWSLAWSSNSKVSYKWSTYEVFFKIKSFFLWKLWSCKFLFMIVKINNFWGDLSEISALPRKLFIFIMCSNVYCIKESQIMFDYILKTESLIHSCFRCQESQHFWDTLILQISFMIMQMMCFRGDLTDISAFETSLFRTTSTYSHNK